MSRDDIDDDDALAEFDLSAWDAPAAPVGLADAAIARLNATGTAATPATASWIEARAPRRRWLAPGVAVGALAAVAGTWLLLHSPHDDVATAPATGEMIADRARHLELDAAMAELDLGAEVRWRRGDDGVRIEQRAGVATWRVRTGTHVAIDIGTASVDATGASLRVEIQPMNISDTRVIRASALTSAAVALITVVVYEGYVKATSGGQTVVVQPGSTVEIRPDQPPREPLRVGLSPLVTSPTPTTAGADLAIAAGESVTIHDPRGATVAVQIQGPCTRDTAIVLQGMDAGTETKIPTTARVRGGDGGVIDVPAGEVRYELRCDGNATPIAAGTIDVVRDPGVRTEPEATPAAAIDANGGTYKIPFQRVIPSISVYVPGTASLYTLIIVRDGVEVHRYTANAVAGTPSSSMTFRLDPSLLSAATFSLSYELDGVAYAEPTTLELVVDPQAPVASIELPIDGARWSSPVHLTGEVLAGAAVTAVGHGIIVDSQLRFAGDLELDSTTLVIRVVHPQRGIHYYIRRAGTGDATLAVAGADRDVAARMMAADNPAFASCLRGHVVAGAIKIRLRIAPSGKVSDVDVLATPDRAVGTCIAAKIAKLTFPKTEHGSSLTVPFVFAGEDGCDADALHDAGVEAEASGKPELAVAKFADAYACKTDVRDLQLAFMASCHAGDLGNARQFYGQLGPTTMRARLIEICIRNGITQPQLEALPPAPADAGTLRVTSKPRAHIYIDGTDTGLDTPITGDRLRLAPGRHKLTFQVGDDRYTFPVKIVTGEVTTIVKDLE